MRASVWSDRRTQELSARRHSIVRGFHLRIGNDYGLIRILGRECRGHADKAPLRRTSASSVVLQPLQPGRSLAEHLRFKHQGEELAPIPLRIPAGR